MSTTEEPALRGPDNSRHIARMYPPEEWNRMRGTIEGLHRSGLKYKDIVSELASTYRFYTNTKMLEPRLRAWSMRRNTTRRRVDDFLGTDPHDLPAQSIQNGTQIMRHINRHGIPISPVHFYYFHLVPDPAYPSYTALFATVSKYVGGAFDNRIWNVEDVSNRIIDDYIHWVYDNPPSVFRLLAYLACAGWCNKLLKRLDWVRLILKAGLQELPACIETHSPETLPVLVRLLDFFESCLPTEKGLLLEQCISIANEYSDARPLKDVFSKMLDAQRQSLDAKMFRNISTVVLSELKEKLGEGTVACTIIQPLDMTGDLDQPRWVTPASIQTRHPDYFNHSLNIERRIVLAIERHGFQELLQIQETLRRQRDLANSDDIREILDRHLTSLERPIQRIGYRDHSSNRNEFTKYWRRTIGDFELDRDISSPNHIMDLFSGIRMFRQWGNYEEIRMIERHLDYVFSKMAFQLGEDYMMVEDEEGLY